MSERAEQLDNEAKQFIDRLITAAGLDLGVRFERQQEFLKVDLSGLDGELVLENNANLLYAIEHIVNQVMYRRGQGESRVMIDCNDYRQTRVLELQLMARKAAERVKTTHAPFSLQPMPAFERRVIHVTLAEERGIRTESSGLGTNRHVVILPAG
jgi:spoIIIJ-associated protein